MSDVRFTDNSDEVRALMKQARDRALEIIGLKAEGYAKKLCPVAPVNGGRLRNSISHKVSDGEVYIGSNAEYTAYVELGTGVYYPGGRDTPWRYQDANGNWHTTTGSPPQPFLKPAVVDHRSEYRDIVKNELKNG